MLELIILLIVSSQDKLWVKLMKKKYLKKDDILAYKTKVNMPWQWRKLMSSRIPF